MCGLCPQVISDLSKEGQRSKGKGKYSCSGAPRLATMLDLIATGGYGLHAMSSVGGIIPLDTPLCDAACDRAPLFPPLGLK